MFKDYCLTHGTFMNPSSTQNNMYRNVVNVFKRYETWQQMIFYCKPYAKAQNEKKNRADNLMNGMNTNGGPGGPMYGETISKPSFILKEKEKEIFLNGELSSAK